MHQVVGGTASSPSLVPPLTQVTCDCSEVQSAGPEGEVSDDLTACVHRT